MDWDIADYLAAAALIGGALGGFLIVARFANGPSYLAGAGLAAVTALILVWSSLAVGLIGSPGHPANLMFAGVLAIGAIGALVARFRRLGLAYALGAMAAAQLLTGLIALLLGLAGQEILLASALFGGLWLSAAWLFQQAAPASGRKP